MWLFPIVFMIHEFEEIIMTEVWFRQHEQTLLMRFPRMGTRISAIYKGLSTSAFSVAVAEEFLLLSLVTWACVTFQFYNFFTGVVIAYGLHLLVHIAQALIWRGYIPAVVTSVLTFPYCIYAVGSLAGQQLLDPFQVLIWSVIASVIVVVNLAMTHRLAHRFRRWEQQKEAQ